MKSLALSLLVAVGLSLGAATASAETPQAVVPSTVFAHIQEAARLAREHEQSAIQYRTTARNEAQAARDCLRIADDDAKQGFMYYATKMREKAAQHQKAAVQNEEWAKREDSIAQHYRAQAKEYLTQKPATRS